MSAAKVKPVGVERCSNDAAPPAAPANDTLGGVAVLLESLLAAVHAARQPASAQPPAPEYLSVADFAARLAVSPRAVRGMIADGMPSVRPRPRTIRIPVARAEAWIAARDGTAMTDARRRAMLDAHRE